ncbi:MAG TPA: OmpA family protein, partial [bacterium]|nr:OmpA family protein [bacterium]
MHKMLMAVLAVLMMVVAAGAVNPGETVVREIYFDLDKAVIRADAIPTLREVAALMRQYPEMGIVLSGYTCDLASNEYNQRLARRRADAALNWLVTNENVARSRVLDSSYGEERPAYPNDTELNRRKNRRVLITLALPRVAAPAAPVVAPAPVVPAAPAAPQTVLKKVTTSVLDANGNFIANLPDGNFTVTENGERREIVRVTQQMAAQRGTLGLLLDNSNSNCLIDLRDASREFIGQRNPEDKLILMTINDNLELLSQLQHDRTGQMQIVNGLQRFGFTHLYDGIYEAVSSHLAGQTAPRFLMVMSDGVDEGSPLEDNDG